MNAKNNQNLLLTGEREPERLLVLEPLDDTDLRFGFLFESFGDDFRLTDPLRDLDLFLAFVVLFEEIKNKLKSNIT